MKVTNTQSVVDFYNHYHRKVVSHPNLYNHGNSITVVLPNDLLEYSNAAAGHSGFGAGARAVGIRLNVSNGAKTLDQIFSSVQSLTDFIESSDCSGPAHVEQVRQRQLARLNPEQKRQQALDHIAIAQAKIVAEQRFSDAYQTVLNPIREGYLALDTDERSDYRDEAIELFFQSPDASDEDIGNHLNTVYGVATTELEVA